MSRMILTDVGNILTTFRDLDIVAEEIMAAFGVLNINAAEIFESATGLAASDAQYYANLALGQFNAQEVWHRLIERHGVSPHVCSYPLFFSLWCKHLDPIIEVVALYRRLQEKFPLIAVSNGDSEGVRHILYHLIGAHGLRFEEIFISAEHKSKKPELLNNVAAFLDDNGIERKNCVFVDDVLAYVQAAENLGIPAIQFDGSRQNVYDLETALARFGFVTR